MKNAPKKNEYNGSERSKMIQLSKLNHDSSPGKVKARANRLSDRQSDKGPEKQTDKEMELALSRQRINKQERVWLCHSLRGVKLPRGDSDDHDV